MGSIAVHVDTTVEDRRGILAKSRADHGLATWMILDEIGDIVNDTGNRNQSTAILGLVDIIFPLHDGKLIERNTPIQLGTLLIQLLLKLLETTLFDFVAAELLEIISQAKLLPGPDGPFGGIILMPLNGISVVRGELVMEVVVSLTESNDGGDDMITRGVPVIEWLITEPVSQRVDAECCLLDEEDSENASVDEATHPVTPSKTSHKSGHNQSHEENDLEVMLVLPNHHWIFV